MTVNGAIEALLVRHDDQFGVAQVSLHFFKSFAFTCAAWRRVAPSVVNVEGDTVDFICTADLHLLPLVNAEKNLVLKQLGSKGNIVHRDRVKSVVVGLSTKMVGDVNLLNDL